MSTKEIDGHLLLRLSAKLDEIAERLARIEKRDYQHEVQIARLEDGLQVVADAIACEPDGIPEGGLLQ